MLGLLIRTQIGFEVYGTNTELEIAPHWAAQGRRNGGGDLSGSCATCALTLTLSRWPRMVRDGWRTTGWTTRRGDRGDERSTAGVANLRAKVTVEQAAAVATPPA